jgi:protein CpxP
MKLHTPRTLIATVLAAAIAGIAFTASAQNTGAPSGPAPMAQMQQRMQSHMAERHARHMERLKSELKITPAQDAAWNAFVARTEPTPPKTPPAAQDGSKLTTPQRLDAMQAMHAERGAEMARRIEATKSFYAQLTPEQQKTFDARGEDMHRAGMKRGHHFGGPGHGEMGGGMGGAGGPGAGAPGPRN